MSEPDWPEREADMAVIRLVNELLRTAAESASQDDAARAQAAAERLMPAYAKATRRQHAAMQRAMARRAAEGDSAPH
jgi:hypothetical protein